MKICYEGASAHLFVKKSKDRLTRYIYGPRCYNKVEEFVKTYDMCQRANGLGDNKNKAPLTLVPIISEIFSKLNIDAVGSLLTSKFEKIHHHCFVHVFKIPRSGCSDYYIFSVSY
ncbi:reverse transcriptase [Caerostris extrusa]|uniref:Reverse transcriptase n=1 Tax=Caerostris extrusa TaxID=172846 RepID=A0AAV4XX26_CAEEX|nr:reverse transcriptase [Caerostris extrusa]